MTTEEEMNEFSQKAIPILEKYGYLKMKEERIGGHLMIIIVAVISMMFGVLFFWAIQNESFKSDIDQSIEVTPNITINSEPVVNNDYSFDPKVENKYNHTIINYIILPNGSVCK